MPHTSIWVPRSQIDVIHARSRARCQRRVIRSARLDHTCTITLSGSTSSNSKITEARSPKCWIDSAMAQVHSGMDRPCRRHDRTSTVAELFEGVLRQMGPAGQVAQSRSMRPRRSEPRHLRVHCGREWMPNKASRPRSPGADRPCRQGATMYRRRWPRR